MKIFILITAVIELVAGMTLFLAPEMVPDLSGEGPVSLTLARMYGGAAIAVGYYALMVWRNFNPGPVSGFLKTFAVFHLAVAAAAYAGYIQGVNSFIGVAFLHGILAIVTIYYLVKSNRNAV